MDDAPVTIVVTPRERFSALDRCLATIAAHTTVAHHLVCVLGAAPRYAVEIAEKACAEHGYELLARPHILAPNQARNLGLERATTRYVVFVDNDVVVAPGWLDALVRCAEETRADIVGSLCLVGEPADGLVHTLGGTIELVPTDGWCEVVERHLADNVRLNVQPIELERAPCDYSEFHCMLVRREVFDHIGPLDEELLSAPEHIDLALQVRQLGGTAWSEPASMVSYLSTAVDYTIGDLELFALRWSAEWDTRSLDHFSEKWGISRDAQYLRELAVYARMLRGRAHRPDAIDRPRVAGPTNHPFAQTNLQLYEQMQAAGASDADVAEVRVAYDAAVILFGSSFRPSGKAFLTHLVGTASILAAFGWRPPVVTAALLHAAHSTGAFPDAIVDDHDARRRWLRRHIGRVADAIVHEYASLDLTSVRHRVDTDDLERLPLNIAYAIAIRIADAIDDHLDQGTRAWGDEGTRVARRRERAAWHPTFAAVAPRIDAAAMLAVLDELEDRGEETSLPDAARSGRMRDYRVNRDGTIEDLVPRTVPPRQPDAPRDPADFEAPAGPPPCTTRVARIPASALRAHEQGRVTRGVRTRRLVCDPRQWAFSAMVDLEHARGRGPGVLRLKVAVESGELGIGVLLPDSSTDFATPEWNGGPTQGPIEIALPLPAIDEAGALVFRSWAPNGIVTRARVHSAEIFAADLGGNGDISAAP